MNKVRYELLKLFPDRKVINLSSNYKNLYQYVFDEMKKTKCNNMTEYLDNLGFQYVKNVHAKKEIEEIMNKLHVTYPEKKVTDLAKHQPLYYDVRSLSKNEGVNVKDFLNENGFTYITNNTSNVDISIAMELRNKYNITFKDIGDLFNVSKQRVAQIIKKNSEKIVKKEIKELSTDEETIIEMMIEDNMFDFVTDVFEIKILNDLKGQVSILVQTNDEVKLLTNEEIPQILLLSIRENRMDMLNELDFEIINKCKTVFVLKKEYLLTSFLRDKIIKASKTHNMSFDEYGKFIGYSGSKSSIDITDEKIIDFFESNIIDSKVYISSNPENHWIRNYASRETNLNLKALIEFYGYEKGERDFESEFKETKTKYRNKLKKYLIEGSDRFIYLSSYTAEYRNIYSLCLQKKIDFDDFLLEIGYERTNKGKRDYYSEELFKSETYYRNKVTDLANKIKKSLQEDKKRERVEYDRRKRNRKYVKELKDLYGNRCQLCHDDSIPQIVKSDGIKYVEVHHIKPLREEEYDEEINLDTIDNMIVVCPHHHKVLHYHYGGYKNLTYKNEHLTFENESDTDLKVYLNYHLEIV